jgi:hypothetical protein
MNKGKQELRGRDGVVENITEEMQFDRIINRSNEKVYVGPVGDVPGKCVIIQDLKFHNPYVLVIAKLVTEEEGELLKEHEKLLWNTYISDVKKEIDRTNGINTQVGSITEES